MQITCEKCKCGTTQVPPTPKIVENLVLLLWFPVVSIDRRVTCWDSTIYRDFSNNSHGFLSFSLSMITHNFLIKEKSTEIIRRHLEHDLGK